MHTRKQPPLHGYTPSNALHKTIIIFVLLCAIQCSFLFGDEENTLNLTNLNTELQLLNPHFLKHWEEQTSNIDFTKLSDDQIGTYLFVLAKMHLYGTLPPNYPKQRSYLLAYHYLTQAAQKYEVADAYYYLSLMEYMKMTPGIAIKFGLSEAIKEQKTDRDLNEEREDIIADIDTHHLHNIEHNLFLASLMGHSPSKVTLAYLLKDGIGTDKNCSAALAYYLSNVRQNRIQMFQFPSDYTDPGNFENDLYCNKKLDLSKYGEEDSGVLYDTIMFDTDSMKDYEDIAMNYLSGQNGSPVDEEKAVKMFSKMQSQSRLSRIMLGFMYLKGRGVELNYEKAKQIFEQQKKDGSSIASETLLVMQYFQMGYKNSRKSALEEIKMMYLVYEKKQIEALNSTDTKRTETKRGKHEAFRTPTLKYLTGTLVLSGDIKGQKQFGVTLIEESAKEGNVMAMVQMGLLFVDGSDLSYDCMRAVEYLSKEAVSHKIFLQRVELAKIGIKKEMYMFSFIKYVQLMMVGYRNAYINALYLYEIFNKQVFNFNQNSWSLSSAKKDPIYDKLRKGKKIKTIQQALSEIYNPALSNTISATQFENYLQINSTQTFDNYMEYAKTKILTIGIVKHDISILKFFKYKKTKQIALLHRLADLGQTTPQILQSRFLLGRYYQHSEVGNVTQEKREHRALQEYRRATKNKFLADLIFLFEGGNLNETGEVGSSFLKYLTVIFIVMIFCYRQKNRRMQQILEEQLKKSQEEEAEEETLNFGFKQPQGELKQNDHQDEQESNHGEERQNAEFFEEKASYFEYSETTIMKKRQNEQEEGNQNSKGMILQSRDDTQPIITDEDNEQKPRGQGVMIGSSEQDKKQHFD